MPRATPEAILLVDGYNMVGAWHELKQVRDRQGLEEARRRLIESLMGYSSYKGFETQIVFDAQYRDSPNIREVITEYVSVYYTDFGQTADTFIERTCADFRQDLRKFKQRLIVATSDQAQKITVIGFGADWMSAERLASDVEFVDRRVQRHLKTAKKPTGRFLMHSLDPIAQQRLAQLRSSDRKK